MPSFFKVCHDVGYLIAIFCAWCACSCST